MKKLVCVLVVAALASACQENEVAQQSEFTGNESTYALLSGSTYPISGTVTFKERTDHTTQINVSITGTEGSIKHPVHLHLGTISSPDADVTALLNPVTGSTGTSETILSKLADETSITYDQLVALTACVKIHLSDAGEDKNIILAAGNIGAADASKAGRERISVCNSATN